MFRQPVLKQRRNLARQPQCDVACRHRARIARRLQDRLQFMIGQPRHHRRHHHPHRHARLRQPLNHLGAPALLRLPGQDVAANLPVEQHQFAVNRQRGGLLGTVDSALELCQPDRIAFWVGHQFEWCVAHACASVPSISATMASMSLRSWSIRATVVFSSALSWVMSTTSRVSRACT